MIFAHIAGIPVEETLYGFGPVGVIGIGVAVAAARGRVEALRARAALWRRRRAL